MLVPSANAAAPKRPAVELADASLCTRTLLKSRPNRDSKRWRVPEGRDVPPLTARDSCSSRSSVPAAIGLLPGPECAHTLQLHAEPPLQATSSDKPILNVPRIRRPTARFPILRCS